MRELPIIFCQQLIGPVYDGIKTHTRRIEGLKVLNEHPEQWKFLRWNGGGSAIFLSDTNPSHGAIIKPRYRVGDECWIKETWAAELQFDHLPPRLIAHSSEIWFPNQMGWDFDKRRGKVRSGRFMCKWMARGKAKIIQVKDPERVSAIGEEDVKAEGLDYDEYQDWRDGVLTYAPSGSHIESFIERFGALWDSLHKKPNERFEHGPWVFPYVFELIEEPK